jgi:hypothetical protein
MEPASREDIGHGLSPGRGPARDWERERETFASALGGERGCCIRVAGDVDGDDEGEKVGYGEVDWDRDGSSSAWDDKVRVREGF